VETCWAGEWLFRRALLLAAPECSRLAPGTEELGIALCCWQNNVPSRPTQWCKHDFFQDQEQDLYFVLEATRDKDFACILLSVMKSCLRNSPKSLPTSITAFISIKLVALALAQIAHIFALTLTRSQRQRWQRRLFWKYSTQPQLLHEYNYVNLRGKNLCGKYWLHVLNYLDSCSVSNKQCHRIQDTVIFRHKKFIHYVSKARTQASSVAQQKMHKLHAQASVQSLAGPNNFYQNY